MKAILVIDMPNSCIECTCSDFNKQNVCQILVKPIDDETEGLDGKPDWCPLKPVPEKQIYYTLNDYDNASMDGWNECIDTILGETE